SLIQTIILFKTQLFHIHFQYFTGTIKDLLRSRTFFIKFLSHACLLSSLSRENKCNFAHIHPPVFKYILQLLNEPKQASRKLLCSGYSTFPYYFYLTDSKHMRYFFH